ncbi:hypothetical protein [Euzebyella saccharophila]|uniref:Macroglobulin domain-containing protein n=1 Tax=Euzebyella saccharophila TaxID=679664 RepID=A0ABV8JP43_9FLAO|nr:hypothetical protein [Euzebyella saccharophila]
MSRKTYALSITIFFMILPFSLMPQSGPFSNDLERIFKSENLYLDQNSDENFLRTWQEHIVLHADKYEFSKNEPLFFKAYILTGTERVRVTLSKVLRLDVLDEDGRIVATQYHRISDGMAQGAISAPKKMTEGNYKLRTYTQWMKNYGEGGYYEAELVYQNINRYRNEDSVTKESLKVAFYPEGGRLIENLDNRILLKTTDSEGEGVNIEGDIMDDTGSIRIPVKYFGDGVSSVRYVPKANKKYIFKTRNGQSFPLPHAKENGYVLSVGTLHSKNLAVKIQTSQELMGTSVFLRGVMNNVLYFKKELDLKEPDLTIDIPKEGIPAGVLEIELVNQDKTLLATRPVEIGLEKLSISISTTNRTDKNTYLIIIKDLEGRPVETDLSLSISNVHGRDITFSQSALSDRWANEANTLTSVHKERKILFKKDLDIMTSYDVMERSHVKELAETIKHPFQKGLNFYGYAYNMDDELLTNTNIQIFGISGNGVFTKEIKTDGSGMLRLEDLQFEGETE